jgi:hypothetical protein
LAARVNRALGEVVGDPAMAHASASEQSRCEHAHSPHDAADERFIQQKDEKPRAISSLQFRSDT